MAWSDRHGPFTVWVTRAGTAEKVGGELETLADARALEADLRKQRGTVWVTVLDKDGLVCPRGRD